MKNLRSSVFSALFTSLIVVGAYLKIPVGPVPIVLANFFVILAGALLGPRWGSVSVGLYLLLGVVGLPVFAGGGGIAYLAGPTGGFLVGYLPSAFIAGFIVSSVEGRKDLPKSTLITTAGLVAGALVIYLFGVPWFALRLKKTFQESLALAVLPFILGDAIKVAGALIIIRLLKIRYPEFFLQKKSADGGHESS